MSSFSGGTVGGNILPDTTGRGLGNSVQPWSGSFQDATIARALSVPSGATANIASQNGSRDAASFDWSQHPAGISAGACTVILSPVPAGVNGADANHYIYLSAVGTPEAVLITGGTAVAGAASGTVTFTAAHAHSTGYAIGSATGGIQEALIDAGTTGSVVISGAVSGSLPASYSNTNNVAILDLRGGTVAIPGGVVGNVTGNLAGNVTGNLTGNVTGNSNGTTGATTPNTGAFTTLSASGQISSTSTLAGNAALIATTATTNQKFVELANTGNGGFYFGIESSVGAAFFTGSNAYESVLYSNSNNLFVSTPVLRLSGKLKFSALPASYANNAAALAGGLAAGDLYRTGADPDVVCVVH